ncbi:GATA zinc finger domain-containing protein 14-like [Eupeodes corollae]|uniref:GATA zinc finger domain-containing protein 14-like n=1 Tax=Eupeodes corollae TaxID=290404 RepID=UPI0024934D1D|nr:GATA zinc finger domain-containing protein 14-like [Eupeodes corollae]XP_055922900.1 GATA zinc finger domain-containing protein 14-like [Eupeodes corollae]
MEELSPPEKFKIALDLISKLPEFDGNNKCLIEFLDRVDSISFMVNSFEDAARAVLTGYIKDKVTGKARGQLQKHGRLTTWSEIRDVLKNDFGERLSVEKLIDSIRTARVVTNIEDYFNKINNLLSRINNAYLLNNNGNDISHMIESNNRIALEAFKNNLPEPTKTIILSRNPNSLRNAFKIILEVNHQRMGPNNRFNGLGNSQNNFYSSGQNTRSNQASQSSQNNCNNSTRQSFQNNNLNTNRQNNNYGSGSNSRQNFNRNSGQSRQNSYYNSNRQPNQNNSNNQSAQVRNNNNSGQSRNSNRSGEPMDISLNEQQNDRAENNANFSHAQRNDFPI